MLAVILAQFAGLVVEGPRLGDLRRRELDHDIQRLHPVEIVRKVGPDPERGLAILPGKALDLDGPVRIERITEDHLLGLRVDPQRNLNMISRYTKEQIVLITTGSQGEPMSALTRMAFADHRQVTVGEDDMIIISARPIPGNEKMVGTVVDELLKRGCDVVYESMYEVHVSGHACQEELKLIQALTKPKYFIPVHGEQKHLRKHAGVAVSMGMPPENIFIGDVGSVVEINEDYMKQLPDVQAGAVMVDGLGVGDVGSIVLRDRKHLAEDGLIIAVCTIEAGSGRVVSGPDIVSRGFVYVRESEALMDEARRLVNSTIEQCADENVREWSAIKLRVRDNLSRLLYNRTKRSPMILPIIMEV